jgi:hypothetical protein
VDPNPETHQRRMRRSETFGASSGASQSHIRIKIRLGLEQIRGRSWSRFRETYGDPSCSAPLIVSTGEGDIWIEPPSKVTFAELFWGDKKKASFAQVVHGVMVGRERGTGPRPRNPEEDWER